MNIDAVLRPRSESALVALEAGAPRPIRPVVVCLLKSAEVSGQGWHLWLTQCAPDHALRWQRLKAGWADYLTNFLRSHPAMPHYRVAAALGCGTSTVRSARARMRGRRHKQPGVRKGAGIRALTEAEEEAIIWFDEYMARVECSTEVELPLTGWMRFRMKVGARRAAHFCTNHCPDLLKRYNDATDRYWQAVMYYRAKHSQAVTERHFGVARANIRRRWVALLEGGVVHRLKLVDGALTLVDTPTQRRIVRTERSSV